MSVGVRCVPSLQRETYHKEEVHIVETQVLQALLQTQLHACVVGGPDLGDDEDVLSLDARSKSILDPFSDSYLVTIAVGAVNQLVALL